MVFATYDQFKYFDSFDHAFTRRLLVAHGVPLPLADMWYNLHRTSVRRIKCGRLYGKEHRTFNGVGQGDPLSLLPALILTSVQFRAIKARWPDLRMGAVIDDRNFRGSLHDILQSMEFIEKFDCKAGHLLQHDKTVMAATHKKDRDVLRGVRTARSRSPSVSRDT